jgi:tetratricopeptide (TPR) repeat protein
LHIQVLLEASRRAVADAQEPEQLSLAELIKNGLAALGKEETPNPQPDAQIWFLRALAQDRRNPDALTGIAHCCQRIASQPFWSPSSAITASALDLGREAISAAIAVDSERGHPYVIAASLSSVAGNIEKAQAEVGEALARDPRNALAHAFRGFNAAFLGRAEETLPGVERALRLGPTHPARTIWYFLGGAGALLQGRPAEAANLLEKSRALNPNYGTSLLWSGLAHKLNGTEEQAAAAMRAFRERFPAYRVEDFGRQYVFRSENAAYQRQIRPIFDQLKAAGLPD